MNDATLNVFLAASSARNPPNVESKAEARIAAGAENVRNSKSSTMNKSSNARTSTNSKSLRTSVARQIGHRTPRGWNAANAARLPLLHRAHAFSQAYAFEASGDLHQPLEILTPDFRFTRVPGDRGQEPKVAIRPVALVNNVLLI